MARKVAFVARANHLSRFDLKYDLMNLPRAVRERSIRLLGEQVAPRVRELLAEDDGEWMPGGMAPARITADGKAVHA